MHLKIAILDRTGNALWARELKMIIEAHAVADVAWVRTIDETASTHVLFTDQWPLETSHLPLGAWVFPVYPEDIDATEMMNLAFSDTSVLDVLTIPIRPMDVLGKIRQVQRALSFLEIDRLAEHASGLGERLQGDVKIMEAIQLRLSQRRFPKMRGVQASSRYLAGLRPGGDFFDLAESKDKSQLSVWMTDCSSYGISSALVSVLVSIASRLAADSPRPTSEVIRLVHEELARSLKPQDSVQVFHAVFSRRTHIFRYVGRGKMVALLLKAAKKTVQDLPLQSEALGPNEPAHPARERRIVLEQGDRIALFSDGVVESLGGRVVLERELTKSFKATPDQVLNEIMMALKGQLNREDPIPAQDCSMMVIDIAAKAPKLKAV